MNDLLANRSAAIKPNTHALLILVVAILWLYLAGDLFSLTMSLDGVIYASIAKLAAAGQGSFWFPPNFETNPTSFHDHPPLGLWLLSQWFVLFGDAFWVERSFLAVNMLAVAAVLVTLYGRVLRERSAIVETNTMAWWPLVIFLLMPLTTSVLKSNSLESLLTLVTLLAVALAWLGRTKRAMNVLVGLVCLIAVLIKGPVGLFPLVAPGCFALLVDRDLSKALQNCAISIGIFCVGFAAMLAFESASLSFSRYFDGQVLASLLGDRVIEHGRAYILGQLGINLMFGVLVITVAWFSNRSIHVDRRFWAFLVIGITASLPLLVSPRQYKHYLLPSMPYFAICFAMLVYPNVQRWRREYVWLVAAGLLVLSMWRSYSQFGMDGKDAHQLADAKLIAQLIGAETVEFCHPELSLRTYLVRHFAVRSRLADAARTTDYYVCDNTFSSSQFNQIAVLSEPLILWRRQHR